MWRWGRAKAKGVREHEEAIKIKRFQEIFKTVNYYSLKYQDSSNDKNSLGKEEI